MKQNFKNKVAIITGASSGIGEATAKMLASEDVRVVLAARRKDRLQGVKAAIEKGGGEALIVETDVTQKAQLENLVAIALDKFGRVDIFVNNAGIMPQSPMERLRISEWEQTVDVNIKGVLFGIGAILPVFLKQGAGHIINVASIGGRRVYPGATVYCASKFAVRVISEGLRAEIASSGVKVTVIEPGAVRTELPNSVKDEDSKKMLTGFLSTITLLEPDDIAASILYALSQADRVNVDEVIVMPQQQGH